jgi:hypothetical protein
VHLLESVLQVHPRSRGHGRPHLRVGRQRRLLQPKLRRKVRPQSQQMGGGILHVHSPKLGRGRRARLHQHRIRAEADDELIGLPLGGDLLVQKFFPNRAIIRVTNFCDTKRTKNHLKLLYSKSNLYIYIDVTDMIWLLSV